MTFLFSLPGGAEWIFILLLLIVLVALPVTAIVFYTKYKAAQRQNKFLSDQNKALMEKLADKHTAA